MFQQEEDTGRANVTLPLPSVSEAAQTGLGVQLFVLQKENPWQSHNTRGIGS